MAVTDVQKWKNLTSTITKSNVKIRKKNMRKVIRV